MDALIVDRRKSPTIRDHRAAIIIVGQPDTAAQKVDSAAVRILFVFKVRRSDETLVNSSPQGEKLSLR